MNRSQTIIAISSPPGVSPRGLVRLSGCDAFSIFGQVVDGPLPPPHSIGSSRIQLGQAVLPVLVSCFKGPRSYTAEEVVEIQLPGNPALMERIIHAFMVTGARLAEPGEFTFRAYLAGRLDLTQAEGVAATIAARSDAQLRAAGALRSGRLGGFAHKIVDELAGALALVEAGIDFTDQEDVVPITPIDLLARLQGIEQQLQQLISRSQSWKTLDAIAQIVLVGRPSVGKSTLFNAMLGRDRAVIDAAPGTTRDVLSEPVMLRDEQGREVEIMLMDIAGLDTAHGALDYCVQQAARRAIEQADVVLHIDDGRETFEDPAPLPDHRAATLHVLTKMDLGAGSPIFRDDAVPISAITGQGMDNLRRRIVEALGDRQHTQRGDALALQPRHETLLRAAIAHIQDAVTFIEPQTSNRQFGHIELIADAMRCALDGLAALGGEMTPDDVIGLIFSKFCIGK